VSVVITFVRVEITLRHTRECHIHTKTRRNYSHVRVNHILRVKSHSAYGNRTLCVEISLVRVEATLVRVVITLVPVVNLHYTCRNHTLRVEIVLCVYKSHSSVSYSHS
jgi:hypothetical protein